MRGVVPLMLGKKTQSRVVCHSECLDLKWVETLWWAAVFTLLMPCTDACVWVRANLRCCEHLSVTKRDWEAMFDNALHGTYWPELLLTSTIAVASKMRFIGLPFKEQCVNLCTWWALCFCRKVVAFKPFVICCLSLSIRKRIWCCCVYNTCFEQGTVPVLLMYNVMDYEHWLQLIVWVVERR